MHDELRRVGLQRLRGWTVVLVLTGAFTGAWIAGAGALQLRWRWPPEDLLWGGPGTVAAGAGIGMVAVLVFLAGGGDRSSARVAWPTAVPTPAPELVPMVDGLALARGIHPPRVWRLASGAPNVACLPGPHGLHVLVSTAAETGLERPELEALVALQMSVLLDDGARRVRRSLVAASRTIKWVIRGSLAAMVVSTARQLLWAGLTINVGVWSALGLSGLVVLVQRRLRWSAGIIGDAVALETTRQPDALVDALRRLAGYNDDQVAVRRTYGSADPYWVVPVRQHMGIQTGVVNGRAHASRTTEQVSDAALLLRAGVVERMALGGEPATLVAWRRVEDTFDRLARFGGSGEGDGTIDGVVVTPKGAQAGVLPPVGGHWVSPVAAAVRSGSRRRPRPWHPRRADLDAYDAAVGRNA